MNGEQPKGPVDSRAAFEQALVEGSGHYLLRLYVAGLSDRSRRAVENIKAVCEQQLKGRYQLEVIDIYQKPRMAMDEQIMAVPTLLKAFPPPLRRVIGDLSDEGQLLFGLDLKPLPAVTTDPNE
jgi:circadian clock protein KaiB